MSDDLLESEDEESEDEEEKFKYRVNFGLHVKESKPDTEVLQILYDEFLKVDKTTVIKTLTADKPGNDILHHHKIHEICWNKAKTREYFGDMWLTPKRAHLNNGTYFING